MTAAASFEALVRSRVDEFLQTVVLVDDQALRTVATTEAVPPAAPEAPLPDPATAAAARGAAPGAPRIEDLKPPLEAENPEELDAALVTKVFAEHGLACAILSPQSRAENISIVDPMLRAARRADLVILDWNLNDDNGETVKEIFRQLLTRDGKGAQTRRLRVIGVYTGEPTIEQIASDLADIATPILGSPPVRDPALPQFTCGPVRVTVLAKEHVELPEHLLDQRTPPERLPDRLTREFCTLCYGLVPAATLAALTEVREQTHRLLSAMCAQLDAALLGHRALLEDPEDAERHLEALISAEIAAIVEDSEAGATVGLAAIQPWLIDRSGPGPRADVTDANRMQFLEQGLPNVIKAVKAGAPPPKNSTGSNWTKGTLSALRPDVTELFSHGADEAILSNRTLFERMQMRTRYDKPLSTLSLGVILERDGHFLVCVQPACDSVRIETERAFPFLTALRVTDPPDARGADLLVMANSDDPGGWLTLKVDCKPSNIILETFAPLNKRVVANTQQAIHTFSSADGQRTYRLIGELKRDRAMQLVSQLGQAFSRVALNRPEVLHAT